MKEADQRTIFAKYKREIQENDKEKMYEKAPKMTLITLMTKIKLAKMVFKSADDRDIAEHYLVWKDLLGSESISIPNNRFDWRRQIEKQKAPKELKVVNIRFDSANEGCDQNGIRAAIAKAMPNAKDVELSPDACCAKVVFNNEMDALDAFHSSRDLEINSAKVTVTFNRRPSRKRRLSEEMDNA